ncbi:MAG: hypothetical protein K2I63_02350 [Helicobacter sp.]|nr:hypothetical protein [Helicobacter sp.]
MMNDENIISWIIIGIALFLILITLYLYFKGVENIKKLKRHEHSIEEINKEIYRLQKKLKFHENDLESFKQNIKQKIYQDIRIEIKNLIDTNLHSQIIPIRNDMELLQDDYKQHKEDLETKILSLEDRIKEFAYTPTSATNIDEGRIIALFKDGWSIDSIAKELRIGKGEVDFTLKFANLE